MAITSGDRAPGYGTGAMLAKPANTFGKKPAPSFTSYPSSTLFNKPAAAPTGGSVAPQSFGGDTGGGGDYGGGTGGGGAVAAPAPAAPIPMKDVDWFAQDGIYRAETGRNLADLTAQLANILADRDAGYRQLDQSRGELTRGRQNDLTDLGNDFAGRGLGSSGLFAQSDDRVQADYTRQNGALDESANQLGQQYGQRNNVVDLQGLQGGNAPANLASIYGLLGAMGTQAGGRYNSAMSTARAQSAQRATSPLVQTTNW